MTTGYCSESDAAEDAGATAGRASTARPAALVLAGLASLLLAATAMAAIVTQRADGAVDGSTVDGMLSADEYGPSNSYSFSGGGTGFGGVLNGANRLYMNSDEDTLYIAFSPGADLNDFAVLYLDTTPGGYVDATMDDDSDGGRRVVTNLGAGGDDGFPARNGTAFQADFALMISQYGCTLFELTGGVLNVVSIDSSCALDTGTSLREVSVTLAALGTSSGKPIDFFMAYCAESLFNSNETIPPMPAINGAPNPGFDVAVDYTECHRFYTYASGTPRMVISQVYGAGGNNFAMYISDYVELHNAGDGTATLTNWSVQYAAATGTSWTVTSIASAVVPPGGYLLVKQADGASLPSPQSISLPTPDFTGTTNMAAGDFKLALCNTTTALTGAPACPFPASVVDFVGAGTTATTREPCTGLAAQNAPAASAAHAIMRRACGAMDTNTNNLDFANVFPAPRNSLTEPSDGLSAVGNCSPYFAKAGQSVRIVVTPRTCDGSPLPSGVTVSADLTPIGGSATQTLYDDGTNGDQAAGDGIYSYVATVGGSVSTGAKHLAYTVSGASGGGGSVPLQVLAAAAPNNDNCSGAQDIPGPYSTPVDVTGTFTGASAEFNPIAALATAPTSGMGARRGLWYTVTGTGNTMTASLCPTSPAVDTVLIVMCGSCDGLSVVANGDDNGPACTGTAASAAWCSTLGQVYYIWVAPFSAAASTAAFTLRISDGVACTTAVACSTCTLTPEAGAVYEQEAGHGSHANDGCDSSPNLFTDVMLTGSTPLAIAGVARGYGDSRDVDWYRFMAEDSDIFGVTVTAQFNAIVSIRQLGPGGVCAGATTLATSASSARCQPISLTASVTAGNWYAVRIIHAPTPTQFGGVAVGASSYNYIGTMQLGVPPANDNCASATPIGVGSLAGSTVNATNDGDASCDPGGTASRDVWYVFTLTSALPGNAQLRIDTCTSPGVDTVVSVYSGACGALTEIGCNDDCSGSPCGAPGSCLAFSGLAPGSYRVRVSDKGLGSIGGTFTIRLSTVLVNDFCADALPITCGTILPLHTTIGATADSPPAPATCPDTTEGGSATVAAGNGVWYRLIGTGGIVRLSTCHPLTTLDTEIIVYSASSDCTSLTCYVADDDTVGAAPDICALSTLRSIVRVPTVAGAEYLVLVDGFGTATGNFVLSADGLPPSISSQPGSLVRCVGESATFSVTAESAATYQWRRNGEDLDGATGSSLTIDPVSLDDDGDYEVFITNGCGSSLTSAVAVLTVNAPVAIEGQPENLTVCVGDPASFSVSATGTDPISYQWQLDGLDIADATEATYSIAAASASDAGVYTCVVTNACGSETSDPANLVVGTAKVITQQPEGVSVCVGEEISLTVVATGSGPLSYQWRLDGKDIGGATGDTYLVAAASLSDSGTYDVVVTNFCGSATSDPAEVSVTEQPVAPSGASADRPVVCVGYNGDVILSASGGSGGKYTWYEGDCGSGAALGTGASLTIPAPADTTTYYVRLEGSCGTTDCASVTVTRSSAIRGDTDGSGAVDFDDINCFVQALISEAGWSTCGTTLALTDYICANDINGDGNVDFDDIDGFVSCLVLSGCP